MMKKLIFLGLSTLLFAGCNEGKKEENRSEKRIEMERSGQACLSAAREALSRKDYKAARQQIQTLRDKYYLALDAREEGILVMDSIALFEAQDELEEIDKRLQTTPVTAENQHRVLKEMFDEQCQKIKFYHRKIQHDKTNKKKR